MHRFLYVVAVSMSSAVAVGDDEAATASTAPGRDVAGVIILDGQPVSDVVLTLCDAESGVPLLKELRRTPTLEEHRRLIEHDLWFTTSDDTGRFQIENVPHGRYRLMAQRWKDAEEFEHPFKVYGHDLVMLGDHKFEVTADGNYALELQFEATAGLNRLVIDGDIDEVSLILLSTEAPEDAVLGLFALAGPFAQNTLGFCRGPLTVEGIPDGTLGALVVILDNLPGANTYSFEVNGGDTATIDVREEDMLAGWSNARRGPMPGLETEMEVVTAAFESGEEENLWSLIVAGTPLEGTPYDGLLRNRHEDRAMEAFPQLGSLRRPITLPTGAESTVGRVLAAMAYYELAQEER